MRISLLQSRIHAVSAKGSEGHPADIHDCRQASVVRHIDLITLYPSPSTTEDASRSTLNRMAN